MGRALSKREFYVYFSEAALCDLLGRNTSDRVSVRTHTLATPSAILGYAHVSRCISLHSQTRELFAGQKKPPMPVNLLAFFVFSPVRYGPVCTTLVSGALMNSLNSRKH